MSILQALVLGIVQGLTEFLPVSSSGHLLLVPTLFGWEEQPLAFDVALHAGTTLAVVGYFFQDWRVLVRESLRDLLRYGLRLTCWGPYGRLALLIALGTIPAVTAGLALGSLEERLRTPGIVAATLALVALYMAAAERWAAHAEPDLEGVGWRTALTVGAAQACALVPGVSRSGSTIATGMFAGLSRAAAARFSFLLATPVTVAALVKELPAIRDAGAQEVSAAALGVGIFASLTVGMVAIRFLLRYLTAGGLYPFVLYRLALAAAIVVVLVVR